MRMILKLKTLTVGASLITAVVKSTNGLHMLWYSGYYTMYQAVWNIFTTLLGIYVPSGTIGAIAAILSGSISAITGDLYSLAYLFFDLAMAYVPGLSWFKLLAYLPKIVGIL